MKMNLIKELKNKFRQISWSSSWQRAGRKDRADCFGDSLELNQLKEVMKLQLELLVCIQ